MPRAFSSGALSIWSNGVYGLSAGILSCSTFVIAAVSVVLPWSMCPMVPMLTCGLVRSNFAFATGVLLWTSWFVDPSPLEAPTDPVDCLGLAAAGLRPGLQLGSGPGDYSPVAFAMISFATFCGTSA